MNKDEDGEVSIAVLLLQKVRTEGLTAGLYVSTYAFQKQDRNGGPCNSRQHTVAAVSWSQADSEATTPSHSHAGAGWLTDAKVAGSI